MIDVPCQVIPTVSGFELGNLYDGPRPTSMTLLERIYGGPRRWSQVYQVTVDTWDRPVSESQLPAHFVLKLYVASELASLEEWDPYGLDHHGSEAKEEQHEMIGLETRAYSRLVGCPVTPRWYGTYQFTLPSGEISVGILLEYFDGEPISEEYILDKNGEKPPFAERMITAAEAITQLHSHGVLHGDIREPNIILLNNPHDPFPIQFVDFGSSLPIEGIREEVVNNDFRAETERWMVLLLGYFGLDAMEGFPALRTIPREGAIMKFIETWDIRPTREEQVEAMVAKRMAKGHCNEATIREILLECYM